METWSDSRIHPSSPLDSGCKLTQAIFCFSSRGFGEAISVATSLGFRLLSPLSIDGCKHSEIEGGAKFPSGIFFKKKR